LLVYSCIYISQGSVATQLTCNGIFNNYFIANCPQNALIKKFKNRLIFSEDIDKSKVARFLWPTVYTYIQKPPVHNLEFTLKNSCGRVQPSNSGNWSTDWQWQ